MSHNANPKPERPAAANAVMPEMGTAVRTGMTAGALGQAVADHLQYSLGRLPAVAEPHDYYQRAGARGARPDAAPLGEHRPRPIST